MFKMFSSLCMSCFLFISFTSLEAGLEKRDVPLELKTSVIVPCHLPHFVHLSRLLNYYQNQTVVPDEVVISLCDCQLIASSQIEALENLDWAFKLIILRSNGKLSPGQNRNKACLASSGGLLILQDADDKPHPQRVEVVKYLFENYKLNHLLHNWSFNGDFKDNLIVEDQADLCNYYSTYNSIPNMILNGVPVMMREVFDAIKWDSDMSGEDVKFNHRVYATFDYNAYIFEYLYHYLRR